MEKEAAVFFPSSESEPHLTHCLSAILTGHQLPPPPPSPDSATQAPPSPDLMKHDKQKTVPEVKPPPSAPRQPTHWEKPRPHTNSALSLPSRTKREVLAKLSPGRRLAGRNHQIRHTKSAFLSPLPHKMSYAALIDALHKASRQNTPTTPNVNSDLSLPPPHSHSVFLDHFSTFAAHSVPLEFISHPHTPSSTPSPPLLVSLPRSLHTDILQHRAFHSDHNYTPLTSDHCLATLPLSLPRLCVPTETPHSSVSCSSRRLSLCSTCNSLFHLSCSHGNLCPSCCDSFPRTRSLS